MDPEKIEPKQYAINLWDESDPKSVINLVNDAMVKAMREVPMEYLLMSERELWKKFKPTPTENRIRLSFWNEYNRAQAKSQKMVMSYIYTGICTHQNFYEKFLKNPKMVAWLLTPPTSYVVAMEEALTFGIEQIRDILELEIVDKKGRVNVKLGELKAKIVAMLDMRVKGAIPQTTVSKNMHIHASVGDNSVRKALTDLSMEEIDKRIAQLEKKDKISQAVKVSEPLDLSQEDITLEQDGYEVITDKE